MKIISIGFVFFVWAQSVLSQDAGITNPILAQRPEQPSLEPPGSPTAPPTGQPSSQPMSESTQKRIDEPTLKPMTDSTEKPMDDITPKPINEPTLKPMGEPTLKPMEGPSPQPLGPTSPKPTGQPTSQPMTGQPQNSTSTMQSTPEETTQERYNREVAVLVKCQWKDAAAEFNCTEKLRGLSMTDDDAIKCSVYKEFATCAKEQCNDAEMYMTLIEDVLTCGSGLPAISAVLLGIGVFLARFCTI